MKNLNYLNRNNEFKTFDDALIVFTDWASPPETHLHPHQKRSPAPQPAHTGHDADSAAAKPAPESIHVERSEQQRLFEQAELSWLKACAPRTGQGACSNQRNKTIVRPHAGTGNTD